MEILSLRDASRGDATAAYVFLNGAFFCHQLEDLVREPEGQKPIDPKALAHWVATWKVPGKTAITRGRYLVTIDLSAHFKKRMIHLLNVPGFDGIRAHGGLRPEDTEGCLLLGDEMYETPSGPRVKSGTTQPAVERMFAEIQTALTRGEQVWWEIKTNPAEGV